MNGSQVILDFSVTPQILRIEEGSAFVFINFFPATLLMISLAIVEGASFMRHKQTNMTLSFLIFALTVDTFCCLLVTVYSLIYWCLGLSGVWLLFLAHLCNLGFQTGINFAVTKSYMSTFQRARLNQAESSKVPSSREETLRAWQERNP